MKIEFPCFLEYIRQDGIKGITLIHDESELEQRIKGGDHFPILEGKGEE